LRSQQKKELKNMANPPKVLSMICQDLVKNPLSGVSYCDY